MHYELTDEILLAISERVQSFEISGEVFEHHEEYDEGMDETGVWRNDIWKRKSDGAFFMSTIGWIRYGYEDYVFETSVCDRELWEVRKETIVKEVWEIVKTD